MVAYSFKKQFAPKILDGTKRGTIRAERKRHARPGEPLQLYTGMRTKACHLIARATCVDVVPIQIDLSQRGGFVLFPNRECIESHAGLTAFAISDGFATWADMRAFWEREHPDTPNFSGVHITWRDITTGEQSA